MLTIDVTFDLICPWCWIGKRHLEQALALWTQAPEHTPAQVAWHGVQLLPHLPSEGVPFEAFYLHRLGSAQAVRARQAQVQAAAQAAGLEIHFSAMRVMPNTARAHRLLTAARSTGLAAQHVALMERLFQAHFVEGRDIGAPVTLVALAQACGVDADVAQQAVAECRPIEAAQATPQAGVPHFIFDRRWSLSGAQPPHVLLGATRQAAHPLPHAEAL